MKNSTLLTIVSLLAGLCFVSAAATAAETRHALVIGNGKYQHARALDNPPNDATAIAAKLATLGFTVIHRENTTLREMKAAIREFVKSVPQGGVALVYYAGHGVEIKGTNYLIPIDAQMAEEYEVPDETVSMDSMMRALYETKSALNIFVLDCCRDDPYSDLWPGSRSVASAGMGMPSVTPPGMFIAFATSPKKTAADGNGLHSPYTEALLAELGTPGIEFEKVFKNVGGRVADATGLKQRPWFTTEFYGNFFFSAGEPENPGSVQFVPPENPVASTPPSSRGSQPQPVAPPKADGSRTAPKPAANIAKKRTSPAPAARDRATKDHDAPAPSSKAPPKDDFITRAKKIDDL